ncbi:MAG: preprotein translocase subunit YajC [Gaiellaceae bacterium]
MRPQRRRQSQQRNLLNELEVGDEIISTGGIFGVIRELGEVELHVEIADGLIVRMARAAVAGLVERDEPEPAEPQAADAPEPRVEPETPLNPS